MKSFNLNVIPALYLFRTLPFIPPELAVVGALPGKQNNRTMNQFLEARSPRRIPTTSCAHSANATFHIGKTVIWCYLWVFYSTYNWIDIVPPPPFSLTCPSLSPIELIKRSSAIWLEIVVPMQMAFALRLRSSCRRFPSPSGRYRTYRTFYRSVGAMPERPKKRDGLSRHSQLRQSVPSRGKWQINRNFYYCILVCVGYVK